MKVQISARKSLFFLLAINVILVLCYLAAQSILRKYSIDNLSFLGQSLSRFDLSLEVSIPTWYNQMILFVSALLFILIGLLKKEGSKDHKSFIFLGLIFVFLSMDEGASIHELLKGVTADALSIDSGIFLSAWVIPYTALVLIFGIIFFRLWITLPKKTKILTATASILYVFGSIGMEMIGSGLYEATEGDMASSAYIGLFATEEFLEMMGVTILIYSLMEYLSKLASKDGVLPTLEFKH